MSTQTQEEWDRLHGSQYDAEEKAQAQAVGWKVLESKVPGYGRVISVVADGDLGVCRLDGGGSSNPKVLEDVRAKARLIAAAPTMYEALRFQRDALNDLCDSGLKMGATVHAQLANMRDDIDAALELAKKGEL